MYAVAAFCDECGAFMGKVKGTDGTGFMGLGTIIAGGGEEEESAEMLCINCRSRKRQDVYIGKSHPGDTARFEDDQ